jgi:Domain of unknown function (DUF1905)
MAGKKLRFKVTLEGVEGTRVAWLNAPFNVPETFGTRARVPVRGTINGFPFRSSLMPMGGCHGMAVNRSMRDGAKAKAGDVVDVVIERDEEARTVEAPPELKKELAKSKESAGAVGQVGIYAQERDGDFHPRCEAGGDEGAASGQGDAGS